MVHVDAAAAAGHVEIGFDALGADLMSCRATSWAGPKGSGLCSCDGAYGSRPHPGRRPGAGPGAGLENVAAAAAFGAAAAELAAPGALAAEAAVAVAQVTRLRATTEAIPGVDIYGPTEPDQRLPHLLCLGVGGVEAEPVLIGLDQAGVAAHSGSSCSSESLEPSPVLAAMGVDAEHSLRLSVGWPTTDAEIDLALRALPAVIGRLRELMKG